MRTKTPMQAEKILTVAARFFSLHRFHEARMDDIAAAAEVSKGTIYRYFKDKDELYLALLNRASEQMSQRLHDELNLASGPVAQLEAIVSAILGYFDDQPHLFDLIQHAEAMHKSESDFPWQKTRFETIQMVRDVFAAGASEGLFAVRNPETAVLLLLGGLRAVIRFGERPRPHNLTGTIVEQFLHGASREPVRGRRARSLVS